MIANGRRLPEERLRQSRKRPHAGPEAPGEDRRTASARRRLATDDDGRAVVVEREADLGEAGTSIAGGAWPVVAS